MRPVHDIPYLSLKTDRTKEIVRLQSGRRADQPVLLAESQTPVTMILKGDFISGQNFQKEMTMTLTPAGVVPGLGAILLNNTIGSSGIAFPLLPYPKHDTRRCRRLKRPACIAAPHRLPSILSFRG